jgi:hypothetical protein
MMANAYIIEDNLIKLPLEIWNKLKLKKGMELKVISDEEDGIIILKVSANKQMDFADIKGIGKGLWKDMDAQDYVNQERNEWN